MGTTLFSPACIHKTNSALSGRGHSTVPGSGSRSTQGIGQEGRGGFLARLEKVGDLGVGKGKNPLK